jgi:hypothetical protein
MVGALGQMPSDKGDFAAITDTCTPDVRSG